MKLSLVAACAFASLMAVASPASASVYTYHYDGQSFIGGLDNPNIVGSYNTSMEG